MKVINSSYIRLKGTVFLKTSLFLLHTSCYGSCCFYFSFCNLPASSLWYGCYDFCLCVLLGVCQLVTLFPVSIIWLTFDRRTSGRYSSVAAICILRVALADRHALLSIEHLPEASVSEQ